MRIGEALTRRAELQRRAAQLGERLRASAVVQEGDKPPEDPQGLLGELDEIASELQRPIGAINATNAASRLPDGRTVTEALAHRDVLTLRVGVLRTAAEALAQAQARYSRSEIRLVRQLDAAALRSDIDALSRERRELDTLIQEHNWTTDLT